MPKKEAPLAELGSFLPAGSLDDVIAFLLKYKVHLTITRERQSVLGDYRNKHVHSNHRISVNGNLNHYSFLVTLLHELAHLLTYEKYGNRIPPHGSQWKKEYSMILSSFMSKKIFPQDVELALMKNLINPTASSCADTNLIRVMRKYDEKSERHLVEELPYGALFKIKGDKIFRKGDKVRKRFKCTEMSTGKVYLFSPVFEVHKVS
ncbi:MAG: SprT-like domain-containing protein [Ginsengibacter sp.]